MHARDAALVQVASSCYVPKVSSWLYRHHGCVEFLGPRARSLGVVALLSVACGEAPPAAPALSNIPALQPTRPLASARPLAPSGAPHALLDEHLVVDLPATVVPERRRRRAGPVWTDIVLEPGDAEPRFVLYAREFYATTTGDVLQDAKQVAAKNQLVARFELRDGAVRAAEITSHAPSSHDPVEPLHLIVAHPDGTLQQIWFRVAESMRKENDAYAIKARAIASTLRAGARRLEAPGGDAHLAGHLVVTLPPGHVLEWKDQNPSSDVFQVHALSPIHRQRGLLQIIVQGGTEGVRARSPGSTTMKGVLLGQETEWTLTLEQSRFGPSKTQEATRVRRAVVALDARTRVHVRAFSPDEATERRSMRIAASLRPAPTR
jgi:hypothetical protein